MRMKVFRKIKVIIQSRFTHTEDSYVLDARKICKPCNSNSLNNKNRSVKNRILKVLSGTLNFVTGNKKDILGQCLECGCSIYHKSKMVKKESDLCVIGKWDDINFPYKNYKSIYIPNKK